MKAAVLHAYNEDMVIQDVAIADPKDREVLVRIAATGVCHSDLSASKGKSRAKLPLILGHEASGVVERSRLRGVQGTGGRSRDSFMGTKLRSVFLLPKKVPDSLRRVRLCGRARWPLGRDEPA